MLFRIVLSRRRRTDGGSEVSEPCETHSQYLSILSPTSAHPGTLVVAVPLSAAHLVLRSHLGHMRNCSALPFLWFTGRWCLPGGLWGLLEHCSYFWHRLFLPLHLEILLLQSQSWRKPSVAELRCHKTSKPTLAQLFSSPMPQHNPQERARAGRAGWKNQAVMLV